MKRVLFLVGALCASMAFAQDVSAPAPDIKPAKATGACAQWTAPGLEEGPVAMGFYDADTTSARRVCPRTEVSLGGRLAATVDNPDFYGNIGANALLSGSWAQTDTREFFATLEVLHYGFVQNAVIKGTELGLGQLTAGASQIVAQGDSWATATSARLMLPTSTVTNARTVGLEVGQALTFRFSERLELHGYAGVDATAAVFPDPLPRFGGLLSAGVQYSPFSRFGVVLDVNGRIGGYASYLAPALALRFRVADAIGIELAASRPMLGTDRPNAVAGLRIAYRAD